MVEIVSRRLGVQDEAGKAKERGLIQHTATFDRTIMLDVNAFSCIYSLDLS
jgi:hypothetical protein